MTGVFEYGVETVAGRGVVLGALGDLSRHAELHPLIVRVEEKAAPVGVLRRFFITDRLRWGFLSFKIRYTADIMRVSSDEVVTVARQWPGTTVENVTRLSERPGGGTRLAVSMRLTAPALLFGYVFRTARAAHAELAVRLKAWLDGLARC